MPFSTFLFLLSKLIFFFLFLSFQVSLSIFVYMLYSEECVTTPYPGTTTMMFALTFNLHTTLRWDFSVLFINKR